MEEAVVKQIIAVVGVAGLAIASLYLARRFRHEIREKIAQWLRNHNLDKSALMDVLMICDTCAGLIEMKIFAKTKNGKSKVSEQTYTLEDFSKIEPSIAAELEKRGHAEKSVMDQVV